MAYSFGSFMIAVVLSVNGQNSESKVASVSTAIPDKAKAKSKKHVATRQEVKPTPVPEPTQHELTRLEQKQDFLASVDESISGARIAGNAYKFVGKNVDLRCSQRSRCEFCKRDMPARRVWPRTIGSHPNRQSWIRKGSANSRNWDGSRADGRNKPDGREYEFSDCKGRVHGIAVSALPKLPHHAL